MEDNPNLPRANISKLMQDRYSNVNRQKEVWDRLHSMRLNDLHIKGESPATTVDKITAYIDKMAVFSFQLTVWDNESQVYSRPYTRENQGRVLSMLDKFTVVLIR